MRFQPGDMMNLRFITKRVRNTVLDIEHRLQRGYISRRKGHFSNFGEQEIIEKYVDILRIAERSRTVVDIGAGDGVRRSNSYGLMLRGWKTLGVEFDSRKLARLANVYKYHDYAHACHFKVTSSNVSDLLNAYSIEKNFGVLSLDIDGCDYWVLDSLLSNFRPDLVVTEYNEKIPPPIKFVVNDVPDFIMSHHFFGYSLSKLKELLAKHDYVLLEVEFNNVFLAPFEIASEYSMSVEQAYSDGYANRPDRKEKFKENENMERLHNMSPEESVDFLNDFYSEHLGQYQIGLE